MKHLLTLILSLTSVTALAAIDPQLVGTWSSEKEVYEVEDAKVFLDVTFKSESVLLTANCLFKDGQTLKSSVETKAEYNRGSIKALESKDHVTQGIGGKECPVFTRPTQIDYQFKTTNMLNVNYKELGLVFNLLRKSSINDQRSTWAAPANLNGLSQLPNPMQTLFLKRPPQIFSSQQSHDQRRRQENLKKC